MEFLLILANIFNYYQNSFVMLRGYSRKFSQRQWKIQLARLSRGNLEEQKVLSWRAHFQASREPKIMNFGSLGATSGMYWVYYKAPVLSYFEAETYVSFSFGEWFQN